MHTRLKAQGKPGTVDEGGSKYATPPCTSSAFGNLARKSSACHVVCHMFKISSVKRKRCATCLATSQARKSDRYSYTSVSNALIESPPCSRTTNGRTLSK